MRSQITELAHPRLFGPWLMRRKFQHGQLSASDKQEHRDGMLKTFQFEFDILKHEIGRVYEKRRFRKLKIDKCSHSREFQAFNFCALILVTKSNKCWFIARQKKLHYRLCKLLHAYFCGLTLNIRTV